MRAGASGRDCKGKPCAKGFPLHNKYIKTAHRAVSDICVNNKCTQAQIGRSGKEAIPHNYSAYIARSDFSSDALKFKSILAYG